MRTWMWIAPAVFLAACTKPNAPSPQAQFPESGAPVAAERGTPDAAVQSSAPAGQAEAAALVIPRGTALRVRLDESVDTRRNRAGDQFRASLAEPVVLNGQTVVPRGTAVLGHVTEADASGRLKGRAVLSLTLDSFQLQGKDYSIRTRGVERVSANHKKHNLKYIGGGAGLGALIGGIAGGGKGALIGAGAGAGAGTAGAAATGKEEIGIAAETLLAFPLESAVTL